MECLASGGVLEPMRVLCLFLAAAACKPAVPSRPGPVEERSWRGSAATFSASAERSRESAFR